MWTDREVKAFQPKEKTYFLAENSRKRNAGRLAIEVRPDGSKHFYFQYYQDGKRRFVRIDGYKATPRSSGLTLVEARDRADELSELYKQGIDVKAHLQRFEQEEAAKRHLEAQRGSFEQLLESYVATMKAEGKRTWANVKDDLDRYVLTPFPHLKSLKAADITVNDIKSILSRMINDKSITTASNRVRSYLHTAFQHGLKQDNDPRNYLQTDVQFNLPFNPVSAIPRQRDFERVGQRHLSDDELRRLWGDCPEKFGPIVGRLLRFMIAAAGQRPNEIISCPWACYDFEGKTLDMPISVTKNKRPHLIPLNDLAIDALTELKALTGNCEYPFAGSNGRTFLKDAPMLADSLNRAISRYCADPDNGMIKFVARDIRRTVKTQMGKAGIDKAMRDRLQNHALNDVSSKHYDRYDYLKEKQAALKVWNDYLSLLVNPKENVIQIKRKSAE